MSNLTRGISIKATLSRVRGAFLFLRLPTVLWALLLGLQLGVFIVSFIQHEWIGVTVTLLLAGWAFYQIIRLTTIEYVGTRSVWILAKWKDINEGDDGANWELTAAYDTREQALANGQPDEFIARLPVGMRTPPEPTVFPDAEWINEVQS